ncbi:SMC-Scp complex subunit ScpB [Nannocystis exedens]|uniref:SMC-Scp complex subunit ScpB n=1 Tax=Nannocystis exedens TaxID=54 RepID=UPI0015A53F7B|nr:SMC-Scp complex subunit ScpB [Nannocystis exedens]
MLSDELPIDPDDDLRGIEGEASARLVSILESLLFSAAKPLSVKDLRKVLQETSQRQIQLALRHLMEVTSSRGVVLAQVAGGFQFRTHPENAVWVQKMLQAKPAKLSRTQIETLAIVAYRQPVTRPEIDDIRGVDSGAVLKSLLERELIQIVGKKDEPGRPLLYGTTVRFLEFFNLRGLRDLPTLRDFRDLSEESKATVRERLGDLQIAEALGQEVLGFTGPEAQVPGDMASEAGAEAQPAAAGDAGAGAAAGGASEAGARQGEDVPASAETPQPEGGAAGDAGAADGESGAEDAAAPGADRASAEDGAAVRDAFPGETGDGVPDAGERSRADDEAEVGEAGGEDPAGGGDDEAVRDDSSGESAADDEGSPGADASEDSRDERAREADDERSPAVDEDSGDESAGDADDESSIDDSANERAGDDESSEALDEGEDSPEERAGDDESSEALDEREDSPEARDGDDEREDSPDDRDAGGETERTYVLDADDEASHALEVSEREDPAEDDAERDDLAATEGDDAESHASDEWSTAPHRSRSEPADENEEPES